MPTFPSPAPPLPDPAAGPPCHLCSALCCTYYALQIDRPVTPSDHDQVRWYLLHENTAVWVQDGDWYLEVRNRCRQLQPDNSCGIYESRPQVCRQYGLPEGDGPCEFFADDLAFDLFFDAPDRFEEWSRAELRKREERLARRRAARRAQTGSPGRRAAEG